MLLAAPAAGQGIYGAMQLQYQKLEDKALLLGGDNSLRSLITSQEYWLRTLDLHQQSYLRPNLLLESSLRYSDRTFLDHDDVSRTPAGSLRLIHPYLQVIASHQPASTRTSLAVQSGLNADSVTMRSVTSHNAESFVSGHVSVPQWPQLDLSWIRRRRDGAGSVADENVSRNARATLDRDRYSVYGGVNDQQVSSRVPGARTNTQQVWTGGGTLRYSPLRNMSLNSQYDLSAVRGVAGGVRRPSNVSQSASVNGDWRPAPRLVGSMSYQWRRTASGTPIIAPQSDQEGSALARYLFARRSSAVTGVGFRTVRGTLPGGASSIGLQRYASALASAEAPVRRNWNMTGSLSHNTNWDPGRGPYNIETFAATTRAPVTRRIQADANYMLTANGDSASAASRYSIGWSARIQSTPLRAIQLSVSFRNLRAGSGIFRPVSVSRGFSTDMTWRPDPRLQILAQYGASTSLPSLTSRSTSRAVSARFEPTSRWQWYGSWTRSDQSVIVSTAGQLSSREVVSSRVQYAPTRRLAASAAVSYNDPGKALESRRVDVVLTWSFGR